MRKLDLVLNVHATREKFLDRFKAKNADGTWKESVLDVTAEMLPLSAEERAHIGAALVRHVQELVAEAAARRHHRAPGHDPGDRAREPGRSRGRRTPRRLLLDERLRQACSSRRCISPAQVTVILFTPDIPFSDHVPANFAGSAEAEPIFTVRHRSRGPGEIQVKPDEEFCEVVQPLVPAATASARTRRAARGRPGRRRASPCRSRCPCRRSRGSRRRSA